MGLVGQLLQVPEGLLDGPPGVDGVGLPDAAHPAGGDAASEVAPDLVERRLSAPACIPRRAMLPQGDQGLFDGSRVACSGFRPSAPFALNPLT